MSSEIDRLEVALHSPAKGESFSDWAESNPEDEYALWLAVHGRDQESLDKRLKRAEHFTLFIKAQVGISGALGALCAYGAVDEGIVHGRVGGAAILGSFSLWLLNNARHRLQDDLPDAHQDIEAETLRHRRASEILAAGNAESN